jgi:hypothetical protein
MITRKRPNMGIFSDQPEQTPEARDGLMLSEPQKKSPRRAGAFCFSSLLRRDDAAQQVVIVD